MAKTSVPEPLGHWPKGVQSLHCSTRSSSATLPEAIKAWAIIGEAARVRHRARGLMEVRGREGIEREQVSSYNRWQLTKRPSLLYPFLKFNSWNGKRGSGEGDSLEQRSWSGSRIECGGTKKKGYSQRANQSTHWRVHCMHAIYHTLVHGPSGIWMALL